MSSPPALGTNFILVQKCGDEEAVGSVQAEMLSIRRPPRVCTKNTIVRSKHSRVTLARSGRRPRQYPIDGGSHHASSSGSPLTFGQQIEDRTTISDNLDPGQRFENKVISAEEESISRTNSCFLCLQDGDHDYAVLVRFTWPGRLILKENKGVRRKTKKVSKMIEPSSITEVFRQDGTEVEAIQAIQDAIYEQSGRWKRWLWCYEVRAAEEIKFVFDDVGKNGRAPIQVIPLAASRIQQTAQKTVDEAPSNVDYDYEAACRGPPCHTNECLTAQDHGIPCIQDRLSEANTRLRGCRSKHWLKECLQRPERAHARRFLEHGLLQESFVYCKEDSASLPVDAKGLAGSDEFRGVYVNLGWNFKRMLFHMRVGSTYTLAALAIIWLASVLWAGHGGDWSTAWAFGQLLAASLALILHHA